MSDDVLARIRGASARVMERARFVRIDAARLSALCEALAADTESPSALDPAHHRVGDAASTLAYVVTLDALNFGSGWFPHLKKREGLSGYFTVALSLKERFADCGPWSARELGRVDASECAKIFGQDPQEPEVGALMELFAEALAQLGGFLLEHHAGRFEGPVEAAGGSAARLVEILATMPFYRDVSIYDGFEVPFYKRAQITAADLASAFEGRGLGSFDDLDHLTIFADNLVPHVLRRGGVLVYDSGLAERIDAGDPLESGAPEEVEIRAGAVHAVERLVEGMGAIGSVVTSSALDQRLWSRGQLPEFKAHPRHRTRTTYY